MLAVPRPFPPETRQPRDAAAGGWQAAIRPSRVWIGAATSKTLPDDERPANGHIDRLVGDEIMATFDTRGDQPDHAERAARAALDVQAETARLAAKHPHWPRFRVGVNTGEALVGVGRSPRSLPRRPARSDRWSCAESPSRSRSTFSRPSEMVAPGRMARARV